MAFGIATRAGVTVPVPGATHTGCRFQHLCGKPETVAQEAADLVAVAVALAERGVPVRSLTLRTPTLDDVFLRMTGAHIGVDEGVGR